MLNLRTIKERLQVLRKFLRKEWMDSAPQQRYGMKIHIKKTKVIRTARNGGGGVNLKIDGNKLEQIQNFKYLGSTLTENGRCKTEVKMKIALAKDIQQKERAINKAIQQ